MTSRKLVSFKEMLARYVKLSRTQINRLEKAGKFPRRVVFPGPTGTHSNSRVFWWEHELDDYFDRL